jgi:hypothetical protein
MILITACCVKIFAIVCVGILEFNFMFRKHNLRVEGGMTDHVFTMYYSLGSRLGQYPLNLEYNIFSHLCSLSLRLKNVQVLWRYALH